MLLIGFSYQYWYIFLKPFLANWNKFCKWQSPGQETEWYLFTKNATKINEIFTIDLTLCSKRQIDGEYLINFSGLLWKYKFYQIVTKWPWVTPLIIYLGSIWYQPYHSEHSDVPYSPNLFLGMEFFFFTARQLWYRWLKYLLKFEIREWEICKLIRWEWHCWRIIGKKVPFHKFTGLFDNFLSNA